MMVDRYSVEVKLLAMTLMPAAGANTAGQIASVVAGGVMLIPMFP
jgi:Na+-transporting methylmalonyl-CoA/oxaloacetate decarboxylase beta subunit